MTKGDDQVWFAHRNHPAQADEAKGMTDERDPDGGNPR
jgi:hypothetical protein